MQAKWLPWEKIRLWLRDLLKISFTCQCSCVGSVLQSCPTLCNPMGCSPPGSSVHGILQARILERVPIPFSRGCCWPRDQTCLLHILHCRRILYLLSHWGSSWGIVFEAISGSWNPYHQEMGCAALSVRIQSRKRKCISCFKREHLIQIIGKQMLENEKGQERNESVIKRVTARSCYHPYL